VLILSLILRSGSVHGRKRPVWSCGVVDWIDRPLVSPTPSPGHRQVTTSVTIVTMNVTLQYKCLVFPCTASLKSYLRVTCDPTSEQERGAKTWWPTDSLRECRFCPLLFAHTQSLVYRSNGCETVCAPATPLPPAARGSRYILRLHRVVALWHHDTCARAWFVWGPLIARSGRVLRRSVGSAEKARKLTPGRSRPTTRHVT